MRFGHVVLISVCAALVTGCTMCGHENSIFVCNSATGQKHTPVRDTTSAAHFVLTESSWSLSDLFAKRILPDDRGNTPFIEFVDDSTFTGSGGCNRIFGRHSGKPPQLIFSEVGSTKMMCREAMETESAFLAALDSCRSYWVVDENLELYRADGSLLARLSRR